MSALQRSNTVLYTYIFIFFIKFFHILFHNDLSQDTEHNSLCYPVDPGLNPPLHNIIVRPNFSMFKKKTKYSTASVH